MLNPHKAILIAKSLDASSIAVNHGGKLAIIVNPYRSYLVGRSLHLNGYTFKEAQWFGDTVLIFDLDYDEYLGK